MQLAYIRFLFFYKQIVFLTFQPLFCIFQRISIVWSTRSAIMRKRNKLVRGVYESNDEKYSLQKRWSFAFNGNALWMRSTGEYRGYSK